MGVAAADYDGDGWLDIVKTNFAGDTSSLYRNSGNNVYEDMTFQSGLGRNTRFLGWGTVFGDFDNDGRPDILLANGHVYPEVGDSDTEAGYKQRKVLYRNLGNGRFSDASLTAGPGIAETVAARGLALGDFDNDGDLDAVVNNINDAPQLLRCDTSSGNNWLKVKCVGTKSNRSAIGTRVTCTTSDGVKRVDEVRSGGSYLSQNDLRLHFGLGQNDTADIEVRWPGGAVESWRSIKKNQVLRILEGSGRDPL
jgi:enediyne biosynthesis protein E4